MEINNLGSSKPIIEPIIEPDDATVCIIRPPIIVSTDVVGAQGNILIPPVGIAYLASYLIEQGIKTSLIDAFGEAPDKHTSYSVFGVVGLTIDDIVERISKNTKVIGVSVMFSNHWPYARDMCNRIREEFPDTCIVLGGEHPTAMPTYCMDDCLSIDYLICGEGEVPFYQLIKRVINGDDISPNSIPGLVCSNKNEGVSELTKQKTSKAGVSGYRNTSIDELPIPAWDLVPIQNYLDRGISDVPRIGERVMPLVTSRGCPYACKFCTNPRMWGTIYVLRDPEKVIEELKLYKEKYNINGFEIIELTFSVKRDWIVSFCELLIEANLDMTWYIASTRSEVFDDEMAKLIKRAGCSSVYLTPDSGSEKQIKEMGKGVNKEKLKSAAKILLKHGFSVRANLVFAFPNEGHKQVWETISYGIELAQIGIRNIIFLRYTPYPGSAYFKLCQERGQIPSFGPEFDNFLMTTVSGEFTIVKSYTPQLSGRAVKIYLILATLITQVVFMLFCPFKWIRSVKNVLTNQPDKPLEWAFVALLKRARVPLPKRKTSKFGVNAPPLTS